MARRRALTAPAPVGAALDLALAREIPLALRATPEGLDLALAGAHHLAPLGPRALRGIVLTPEQRAGEAVIALRLDPGVVAIVADAPIRTPIELARGDIVRITEPEPWELRVAG